MISFHNDEAIKLKYLNRVHAHQIADELVKGATGDNGKGCAVWCTLDKYEHKSYETELGIPEWLARIEDCIFEGLPDKRSQSWPEEFLKVISVGKDLEQIKAPFMIFILECSLENFDHTEFPDVKSAVDTVIRGWRYGWTTDVESAARSAAWSVESAAWSAAWSAARSATESAAESAARSAAESAAWSAESAAWSAAWSAESAARSVESATESAARSAAYVKFADKLIELLSECT